MKTVAIVMIIIVGWFGCGFVAFGIENAMYRSGHFSYMSPEECRVKGKGQGFGVFLLGPIGLGLSLSITGMAHYGMNWNID